MDSYKSLDKLSFEEINGLSHADIDFHVDYTKGKPVKFYAEMFIDDYLKANFDLTFDDFALLAREHGHEEIWKEACGSKLFPESITLNKPFKFLKYKRKGKYRWDDGENAYSVELLYSVKLKQVVREFFVKKKITYIQSIPELEAKFIEVKKE